MDGYNMYELTLTFERVKDDFEVERGELSSWSNETKVAVASEVMKLARQAVKENIIPSAYAAALFSLYLELQPLSGPKAERVAEAIQDWHSRQLTGKSRQQIESR